MQARIHVLGLVAIGVGLFAFAASGQGITIDGTQIFFPDGTSQSTAPKDP